MALQSWLSSPYTRHFPSTLPTQTRSLSLAGALNEPFNFQAGLRSDDARQNVHIEVKAPSSWDVRVRRVGFVPVAHHNQPVNNSPLDTDGRREIPGYVPDPLFDEDALMLPPEETHSFWITATPGRGAAPGRHKIRVKLLPEKGRAHNLDAVITLHPITLPPRKGFNVTNWFYADSLMDWYKTDGFDKRFWEILAAYLGNISWHGQDTVYVPVFTPPLDGVKRPTQLLNVKKIAPRRWRFDWRDARRYVRLARARGLTHFEWCHPFTQWGARNAIRIYDGQGRDEKLLWPAETSATSPVYRPVPA